jgi:hypothetical protein
MGEPRQGRNTSRSGGAVTRAGAQALINHFARGVFAAAAATGNRQARLHVEE